MPRAGQISVEEQRLAARRGAYWAIAAVSGRQHGLITRAQLLTLGLGVGAIQHRVRSGRLFRVHAGVYAPGHPPATRDARDLAAVLACGAGALLSHAAAARLWGIRASAAKVADVISPRRSGRTRPEIRVHRATGLAPADVAELERIPCTALPRTLIDLAEVVGREALEYAFHRAETKGLIDEEELLGALERCANRSGARRIRSLYAEGAGLKSGLERRFRGICRRHGIPPPLSNHWIALDGFAAGGVEVDFCWPAQRLVVETDSRRFHSSRRAFRNDRARDRALSIAGWRVLPYTGWDLDEREREVASEVIAMTRPVGSPAGRADKR